jgi:dUTPase
MKIKTGKLTKKRFHDAGLDIHSAESIVILARDSALVSTELFNVNVLA